MRRSCRASVADTLSFRSATSADRSTLLAFILELVRETEGRMLDAAVVARGLDEALASPAHRAYHVAELDGEVVACCLVTTEWSDWTGTWYWWFQSVYVVPEHRGRPLNVWPRLYEWVCARALEAGCRVVKLYVHEDNARAQRSYERLGMQRSHYLMYEADL